MVNYLIQPYSITITYKINHFDVTVMNLELKSSAQIQVKFYDENHECRRMEMLTIDGADYANWTNDDYLIQWVCKQCNITLLR